MLIYLLKVCFNIAVFYGLYKTLLQNSRFFQLNRVYLVGTAALSFLLPLSFPVIPVVSAEVLQSALPEVAAGMQNLSTGAAGNDIVTISGLYYAGVIISVVFSLIGIFKTVKKIYSPGSSVSSFSFFGRIYTPGHDKNSQVLMHEMVHVKQWHSLDVLFFECIKIVLWFFPLAYLLRSEIRQVHEYLADEAVCESHDKAVYCELLLAENMHAEGIALAHSFYQPSIKKRIMMIVQQNHKRVSGWRYVCILPAVLVCIFLTAPSQAIFAQDGKAQQEEPKKGPEKMPEYKGGTEALIKYLSNEIRYPESARKSKKEGRVVITFTVSSSGKLEKAKVVRSAGHTEMDSEALRVVNKMQSWTPAQDHGKAVACEMTLPVSFKLN